MESVFLCLPKVKRVVYVCDRWELSLHFLTSMKIKKPKELSHILWEVDGGSENVGSFTIGCDMYPLPKEHLKEQV